MGRCQGRTAQPYRRRLPSDEETANRGTLERLLEGLRTGDPAGLRHSEDDRRQQPYRLAAMPTSRAIFDILVAAPEVAGAYLSGAGTTVAGWIVGDGDPVKAISRRLARHNIPAEVRLVKPDFNGVGGTIHG